MSLAALLSARGMGSSRDTKFTSVEQEQGKDNLSVFGKKGNLAGGEEKRKKSVQDFRIGKEHNPKKKGKGYGANPLEHRKRIKKTLAYAGREVRPTNRKKSKKRGC